MSSITNEERKPRREDVGVDRSIKAGQGCGWFDEKGQGQSA